MASDGLRGSAVGEGGTILRTGNAGASWQTQTAGTTKDLRSIQMASDGLRGWAVGEGGTILLLTIPDVSAIQSAENTAAAEVAVTALAPPHGVPKEGLDKLRSLEEERKKAELQRDNILRAADYLGRQVREPPTQQSGGNHGSDFLNPIFLRAYLNRAIVMLIVFFSVSVLLSVFRYSLRLASQYDGRADALQLSVGEIDKRFHRLAHTMVPVGVDFGKAPRSPGEMMFDAARDLARTTSRRTPPG
ncbi:MAG: hypothetical protein EXR07_06230 [Acetobacteraceae bacterium]|nr:hypothetical protein [Acetobacteraceae bacterium]